MKKAMLAMVMGSVLAGTVQAEQARQSLLSHPDQIGGFGGVQVSGTSMAGGNNVLVGGYGAVLLNERLYIGGGGQGAVRTIKGSDYQFGYGGVTIGYFVAPRSLIHSDFSLFIGAGGLAERGMYDETTGDYTYHHGGEDAVMVFEPRAALALNVAPFTKITLGVSYRFVDGVNTAGISNKDLSGANINASMIFGRF